MHLPPSVHADFQGTAQAFTSSLQNEPLLVAAALLAVYIVLGMLYESYVHPVTILSTLPSAGIGALVALMLFGVDLSIIAIIGLLLLIGIVKKNAILLIDFAIEAERNEGASPEDAIVRACSLRFRPILMTTFAALFGALPLAFGTGLGLRAAAAARHHDRRRPARLAAAHALHDAGRLPRARAPAEALRLVRARHPCPAPRLGALTPAG